MSVESNKGVVRSYFLELWNQRRLDLMDKILTSDHVVHFPPGQAHKIQSVQEWTKTALVAFPDVMFEIQGDMIGEGDLVAARWKYVAKQTGSFIGFAPTNIRVEDTGINFFRVKDGKITDIWVIQDSLGLLQQLKVIAPLKPGLTPEQNNAICELFFESVWNKGDFSVLDTLVAPDAIDHSTVGGKEKAEPGSASFRQIVGMFRHAMPDVKMTILDKIYAGDKVVHRWSISGTDTGGVMGMPPSKKQLTFTGTTTVRLRDGKIVERWTNIDELGLLQQLGVVPPPPGAK